MATIKQINANRKNALLSRGPTSKLGKLNSSKNSLKHGLTAKQLAIGENIKEFEKYRDRMIGEAKAVLTGPTPPGTFADASENCIGRLSAHTPPQR